MSERKIDSELIKLVIRNPDQKFITFKGKIIVRKKIGKRHFEGVYCKSNDYKK